MTKELADVFLFFFPRREGSGEPNLSSKILTRVSFSSPLTSHTQFPLLDCPESQSIQFPEKLKKLWNKTKKVDCKLRLTGMICFYTKRQMLELWLVGADQLYKQTQTVYTELEQDKNNNFADVRPDTNWDFTSPKFSSTVQSQFGFFWFQGLHLLQGRGCNC